MLPSEETPHFIPRAVEPVLRQRLDTFSAVALTGPRQTGKSSLLRKMLPDYTYITLDDPFARRQAEEDPELLLDNAGTSLVIDEVQYAPSILSYLKMRIDERRNTKGQYVLTGSQQFSMIRNLRIAGRTCCAARAAALLGWRADICGCAAKRYALTIRSCLPRWALSRARSVPSWRL